MNARARRSGPVGVGALQGWFQAAIFHPRGTAGAVADRNVQRLIPRRGANDAGKSRRLEDVLEPSRQLTAQQRLEIYATSYFLRLRDVLKSDFAGVAHALGTDRRGGSFDRVAREFVTRHPSVSFTLNDLGARFPRFLARESKTPAVVRRRKFLAELATLERAVEEVFHVSQVEPASVAALESIAPAEWGGLRFGFDPSVRLFAFETPVGAYLQAVYESKSPRAPKPKPTWIVVHRRDWRAWRVQLNRVQFVLLQQLERGVPLGRALGRVFARSAVAPELIGRWLRDWTADGLFAVIRTR